MTWFKVDDTLFAHPKARRAGLAAMGLWTVAGSWSSQQMSEGVIDTWVVDSWPGGRRAAAALVTAGLWHRPGHDCPDCRPVDDGFVFHQWTQANPTRSQIVEEREWNRRRQALSRDPELRDAIRARDGDRCRYCGTLVNWNDRRSAKGGTYDHVIPRGPDTLDNLVVACRACNSSKGNRSIADAGMTLLAPKSLSGPTQTAPRSDPDTYPDQIRVGHNAPVPTRPDPSFSMGQVGGGSSGSERERARIDDRAPAAPPAPGTNTPPPDSTTGEPKPSGGRPRCIAHAHLADDDPGPSCAGCKQARLAAADAARHEAYQATRRIRDCGLCDTDGRRLDTLGYAPTAEKCDHQPRPAEPEPQRAEPDGRAEFDRVRDDTSHVPCRECHATTGQHCTGTRAPAHTSRILDARTTAA